MFYVYKIWTSEQMGLGKLPLNRLLVTRSIHAQTVPLDVTASILLICSHMLWGDPVLDLGVNNGRLVLICMCRL